MPGAIAFTVIFLLASESAKDLVRWLTAAFEALYGHVPEPGAANGVSANETIDATEEMLITLAGSIFPKRLA
jgi:hypothetical protein